MTSMHAFYSLGAILGSLAGGGLAWAGVGLLPSLVAVGVLGALIDGTAGPWLLPEKSRPRPGHVRRTRPGSQLADSPPVPSDTGVTDDTADARRRVRRLVLALGVLGVCGLVGEGAAGDWSAVYLQDNLGTSAGFAALGFSAFSVTMTLGRGIGDRLIHRFGVVSVIRVCGLIATAA